MRKQVVLGLALMIGVFSFAQKKELKIAEKAIKSSNFADAKAAIGSAEALLSAMDAKTKAKFYYLKGQALYANGAGSDNEINGALASFKMLGETEKSSGKMVYSSKADALKIEMSNAFLKKASSAYEQKNYKISTDNFERAYRMSTVDTMFLFNAATVAVLGKNYDTSLKLYNELMELGFTGISMEYMATEVESGKEITFSNASLRDISVRSKSHNKSRNVKTKSKRGEIAKNVALIYVEQGENEKAIDAIETAKLTSPDDFNLILSEANVYFKMGKRDKYKEIIKKALDIQPNNLDLIFNLGVFAAEDKDFNTAKGFYDKVIGLDENYTKAHMNMAALILDQEQGIIDEMNTLGSSAADDKKYDELREKRQQMYRDAVPYLNTVFEKEPDNISAAKTLMNIYSAIDDTENYKAMKAKVEAIETQN